MTIQMEIQDKNLPEIRSTQKSDRNKQTLGGKTPKKFNLKKILISLLVIALLGSIGFGIYKAYTLSKDIGFKLDSKSVLSKQPELKKTSDGKYTNILLVGIDTREGGTLFNTDSIIVMSYNYESKNTTMLSIPRDLNVEIGKDSGYFQRINSAYASGENRKKGEGLSFLQSSVEEVTGLDIQYYAMVDFKAFTEIVDLVGGVDINVENSFTDYSYPGPHGKEVIKFEAGPQTMDGTTALKFARSRHAQQNNEGTDYARARRQQKVIMALKDKILSNETLTNPKRILDIFTSLSKNIKVSEFTMDDIEAALYIAKGFQEGDAKSFSFVLDPASSNYSLVEHKILESGAFAIVPKQGLGIYTNIHKYIQKILEKPGIYEEHPRIYVYNTGLGYQQSLEKVEEMKDSFPYLNIIYYGTLYKDQSGITVYSDTEDFPYSLEELSNYLNADFRTKPEYVTKNVGAGGVTILLGKEIQEEEQGGI